jgi:deoxyribose-phosphate aldolase
MAPIDIARLIDHTALKPETARSEVRQLCLEAELYGFASVCVMPYWAPEAVCVMEELGSSIPVGTVIGFPNGAHRTAAKVAEALDALRIGARELDMVINVGAVKSGLYDAVAADIIAVTTAAREYQAIIKVILETSILTEVEKRHLCEICGVARVDFVKTSTGFAGGGATVDDVVLLREATPRRLQVKASGGIRDFETAMSMIKAGATRIGTSSGVAIVTSEILAEAVG